MSFKSPTVDERSHGVGKADALGSTPWRGGTRRTRKVSSPARDQRSEVAEIGRRVHPPSEQEAVLRRVERELPQQRRHLCEHLGRVRALPIDVGPALACGEERSPPAPHLVLEQPEYHCGEDLLLRATAKDLDVVPVDHVRGVREPIRAHARRVPLVVALLKRILTVGDEAAVLAQLRPIRDEDIRMPAGQDDPPVVLDDVIPGAADLRERPLVRGRGAHVGGLRPQQDLANPGQRLEWQRRVADEDELLSGTVGAAREGGGLAEHLVDRGNEVDARLRRDGATVWMPNLRISGDLSQASLFAQCATASYDPAGADEKKALQMALWGKWSSSMKRKMRRPWARTSCAASFWTDSGTGMPTLARRLQLKLLQLGVEDMNRYPHRLPNTIAPSIATLRQIAPNAHGDIPR
eukprot:CAMPEP_0176203350 /NCGR_PEP_ID=MMETSP0121_2-20121125/10536_1 /TAXON_ID=160619 /ORGANISM="Kryptoperidinium foliaceum, Strain CCMP 1326" /LENGTH=407 /DNA_ID=CAMNT_0017542255 /DNA_START=85 /DNA_END=1306 /DNA_ORIENTATION=-